MNRPTRLTRLLATLASGVLLALTAATGPAHAQSYVPIDGSGSTWSANAISQWIADVKSFGMPVNYSSVGSSRGRQDFANKLTHFGVSEIQYGIKDANGNTDGPNNRAYAYMPIVAGGTAFMYHLTISGQLVRNLRLSGATITKIFSGKITNWSDPAITADNNGRALPSKKIIPIVRSDGSGTSAQFTLWMSKQHGGIWGTGMTSYFPQFTGSVAKSSSTEVATYISAQYGEGAIGYVEYSYARAQNYPVAKVLNNAGYYTEPTDSNVAVALTQAKINRDNPNDPSTYLTQQLDGVYNNGDKRTYPLSSYSYMIVPTAVDGKMNEAAGRTLGAFSYYFLCQGQQKAGPLGYSPLPLNLVQAGYEQVHKIPGAEKKGLDAGGCNNPTFDPASPGSNKLAATAKFPEECDKTGAGPCGEGGGGGGGGNGGGNGNNGGGGGNGSGNGGPGGTGDPNNPNGGDGTQIDPITGEVIGGDNGNGGSGPGSSGVATELAAGRAGTETAMGVLAAIELLLVLVVPAIVARTVSKRRAIRAEQEGTWR
ncbi:phosphate ABC transporter phosphate-binding protein [Kibdelosporangium banguiense]|uniref:Phosphate ABC transporter phosphate-binding protein n=1 Tax=Kibdelosporangium banguiense TaxID=1365924 RepID=A0ABS4T937_9PSEU|nr:phosphate ABC transporter substrate-binding protein PstS [Kibdelosporangium banguiense]MBP2320935.1 phosphate ABC transporter phosphate-binding protein [Kibdelosporangium banguiense]